MSKIFKVGDNISPKKKVELSNYVFTPFMSYKVTYVGKTGLTLNNVYSIPNKELRNFFIYIEPTPLYTPPPPNPRPKAPKRPGFTKHDSGKPMLSLVDPQFIIGTGEVLTFGLAKYSRDNWKNCEDPTRYKDAMLRHTMAYMSGELSDPETGLSHLYHINCCSMFLDYFDRQKPTTLLSDADIRDLDMRAAEYNKKNN